MHKKPLNVRFHVHVQVYKKGLDCGNVLFSRQVPDWHTYISALVGPLTTLTGYVGETIAEAASNRNNTENIANKGSTDTIGGCGE